MFCIVCRYPYFRRSRLSSEESKVCKHGSQLCLRQPADNTGASIILAIGNSKLGLYYTYDKGTPTSPRRFRSDQSGPMAVEADLGPVEGAAWFKRASLSQDRLYDYIYCISHVHQSGKEECMVPAVGKGTMGATTMVESPHLPKPCIVSFHALKMISQVYSRLEGAKISPKLLSQPLHKASWVPKPLDLACFGIVSSVQMRIFTRAQANACITQCESGTEDIEPDDLDLTIAVCSENSIFVVGRMLSDPFEMVAESDMRRIAGSIDRPGICTLIAPYDPQIRPLFDKYNFVMHAQYDGQRGNHFKGTTLHLSFTAWSLPLESDDTRTIDYCVYYIESVVSVLDKGE